MFKNAISYLVTPGFRLDPEMLSRRPARLSTPLCALPPTEKMKAARRFHHKTPNLIEAYRHFTGRELENAHSAMADVMACRDVYFAIQAMPQSDAA